MQNNKKFNWNFSIEEIPSQIYVVLAIFMFALNTVLCAFTAINPVICGIIIIVVYGIIALSVYFFMHKKTRLARLELSASKDQSQNVVSAFRKQIKIPYAVVNEKGKIITVNQAFISATGNDSNIFKSDINTLCGINLTELISICEKRADSAEENEAEFYENIPIKDVRKAEITEIGDKKYRLECYPISSKGSTYQMILFYDITELEKIFIEHKNKHTAIGYIVIDNLEEIAQYVKISYQDETRKVGKILAEWMSQMGGTLCEYEDNKFIILCTQEMLSECIKGKFNILSEIHKIEIGDSRIPLSVSMGIATTGETLEEREHDAMVALDMALQRGGDQVVLKSHTGIFYFGAKTKTLQKRTRGHGKIIYAKLAALTEESSNVLIMGHKNPDFDSIGACIGMFTLIKNMFPDKNTKIVIDTNSKNFITCTQRIMALDDYKGIFIDGARAIDYNSSETLLIIVDANNMAIVESPDLARSSFKTVVIDHHIKKEEFENEPEISYIDPSASSTCELISEMLEETLPADISFKEEANIMMSGIMLDTKNFTRTVGMRTFAAALYLKNVGADPEYSRTFFEEEFEEYQSEAQFGSQAKIYRGCIAIAGATDNGSTNGRVLAAKAADKLLTIKNVNAAFALILIENNVFVSARSNGSINVQLIAENLGGGGHFDMAGACIADSTIEEAEVILLGAIDKYFESVSEEEKDQ